MKYTRFYRRMFGIALSLLIVCTSVSVVAQTRPRSSDDGEATRKIVPVPRETPTPYRPINIELWFDKQCGTAYRQGEKIIISFRTDRDGYVTLYDIDTRGQVSIVFPNREQPSNFVRANQTYSVPNRNYSYDLIVEGPEGIEYVDAVASVDPYYQWDYSRGEPRWLYDWGLKGRQERDISSRSAENYKNSSEYQNRPGEFGETGTRSIQDNYAKSRQLREQIRSKVVEQPRDPQYGEYATATCYFYVTSYQPSRPNPPVVRTPTPRPSAWNDALTQQQRELQQIPEFNVTRSGDRLIVSIPNSINGRTYLFDFDSYELQYQARQDLDLVAQILSRYPETYITVAGHTDSVGDANYNQRLSEYRAQAVANYLISRGLHPNRITFIGYGESMPIASNVNEAGRQRNRRVELYLTAGPYLGR